MTSEGLGEIFEGDSADTCAGKFPLVLMGAERGLAFADPGARIPIGASRISIVFILRNVFFITRLIFNDGLALMLVNQSFTLALNKTADLI